MGNLTPHEEDVIIKRFSIIHPKAQHIDVGFWDGVIRKYDKKNQRLGIGYLNSLIKLLNKHGFAYEIVDSRVEHNYNSVPIETIDENFLGGIKLEQYQIDGIKASYKNDIGLIVAITGAGKTEMLAGVAKAHQCPTVILANQRVVIDQIKERLELRCAAEEVGLFYAGKTPNGQMIVVGSIQSLVIPKKFPEKPEIKSGETDRQYQKRLDKWQSTITGMKSRVKRAKTLRELIKRAEMLIVDEADLASSDQYTNVLKFCYNGRKRYGFTGTPTDPSKPLEALQLEENLGPIIYEVPKEQVQAAGRINPVEYYMIAFGDDTLKHDASAFDIAYTEKVVNNIEFHNLVKLLVDNFKDQGTLILVDRDALGESLRELIPGSVFIHGKTPKKTRAKAIAEFEARTTKTLIGGKILARGLDLSGGVDNLIIATGGKLQSDFRQKFGRALRLNKRGKSRVFDFLFLLNKYLYTHSRARLKVVVEVLGYKAMVLYKDGKISGEELIRRRFRRPRQLS